MPRLLGGEKSDECRDVPGLREAGNWDVIPDVLLNSLGHVGEHICLCEARRDAVGGRTARSQLLGKRLGQAMNASLRSRVVGLAEVTLFADDAGDVDYAGPRLP